MAAVGSFFSGLIGATAPAVGSAAFGKYLAGVSVKSFLTTTFAGRMLSTVAFSALSAALRTKPTPPGIRSQRTSTGGTTPASFVLGWFASGGQEVCPPMSHGQSGKTPNAYQSYVVELGDIPGQDVDALLINNELVTIGTTPHPDYGYPLEGKYAGYAWVKIYDGTQTVADPMLVDKYGSFPERPWNSNMVGAGIPYLILTCLLNRELLKSDPNIRVVTNGIPLYDPRKDDTVGGSGTHRWDDKSTWEPSSNNIVQAFNIMRGIELPSGDIWGGEIELEDLPLNNWMAGMNACDASIALDGGGSEPAFRSGIEVFVTDLPVDILLELGKAATAQFAESGGVFKVRVGGPGLPVIFLTDDDMSVSEAAELRPFRSSEEVHNGIHGTYPEPEASWQAKDAPPLYNATYEAEDGERRVANVNYAAVPYGNQVQRLNRAALEEARRFRQHSQGMCPEAKLLEPLDAISWTSDANSYTAKIFEISTHRNRLGRSIPHGIMRERGDEDWDWQTSYEQPVVVPSPIVVLPPAQVLTGWTVSQTEAQDQNGGARGPGILIEWPTNDVGIAGISYEVRVQATGAVVASGSSLAYDLGEARVFAGIQPGVLYEVRMLIIPIGQRQTAWTGWIGVTAPTTRVSSDWYRYELSGTVSGLNTSQVAAHFATDPGIPSVPGDKYVLADITNPANVVEAGYVFDGVNWIAAGPIVSEVSIFDNAIHTRHLVADAVTADKVLAATLAALSAVLGQVEVTEALDLKRPGAKFLGGKRAPSDLLTPGFMIGRVERGVVAAASFVAERQYRIETIGTTDFTLIGANGNVVGEIFRATGIGSGTGTATEIGYEMSATSDASQSISGFSLADGGAFRIFNPTILIGDPTDTPSTYTVSTNVNLGPNASIQISAIGGGGAAGAGTRNYTGSGVGADGQDTVVKVWDGDPTGGGTLHTTLTAPKGKGGQNAANYQAVGEQGEGTPYGLGGAYGPHSTAGGDAPQLSFGAGGGSGGSGSYWLFGTTYGYAGTRGEAGAHKSWEIDTSGFSNDVWLEITIGNGGARNTAYDYDGGSGADGAVEVQSALAGLLDIGYGSIAINRSYGPTSTTKAAINAGNVDLYNDPLPSGLVGVYLVDWRYATDTDATTGDTWIVVNSLRIGDTILNSGNVVQDDTPNTVAYQGSQFVTLSGGEDIKFRWDQNVDNDIARADLDYLEITISGPFKDLDA